MKTLYKVLCYIGLLWIIGLFINDKDVKYHVGQGIILNIFTLLGYIIIKILTFILKIVSFGILGIIGKFIYILFIIYIIYLIIIGISNALSNKNSELPLIGKYSFYK